MAKRERELACKGRHQQSGGGEVFCEEFLDTLLVLVTLEVSFFLFFSFSFCVFVYFVFGILLPKASLLIILIIITT